MNRTTLMVAASISLLGSCSSKPGPDLSQLQRDIAQAANEEARTDLVDEYLDQAKASGVPILENDTTAQFVYHGPVSRVRILGDMTQWAGEIDMERIEGTDLFFYRGAYPSHARLEYLLMPDDGPTIPDPLNQNQVLNGLGRMSELVMPGYLYDSVFDSVRTGVVGHYGRLTRSKLPAGLMGYSTEIHVYVPPGFDRLNSRLPAAYVLDGRDYIEFAHTPHVLDDLIESKTIRPVVAVFVSPPNRHLPDMPNRVTEYGMNAEFARFMAEELVPYVDERYNTRNSPGSRLVVGPSFGGLGAAYTAFQHPETFGLAYSQSGYLSFGADSLIKAYNAADALPVRLYVDIGQYERQVGYGWLPEDEVDFLEANRRFRDVLSLKGYDFIYREYPEGHTWGNWRAHLSDVLVHFFPPDSSL